MRIPNKGFTLLELMVVIAITGILSGASVVSFIQSKRSTAVKLAAENFAQYLRTTESMTRAGAPFPSSVASEQTCNGDRNHKTTTPCGGFGVVVRSDGTGYERYADITIDNIELRVRPRSGQTPPAPTALKSSTDIVEDQVKFTDPILITTGSRAQVEFVPPKDGICIYDAGATSCGPWDQKTIVWTFGYGATGSGHQRTVKLDSISGMVTVE